MDLQKTNDIFSSLKEEYNEDTEFSDLISDLEKNLQEIQFSDMKEEISEDLVEEIVKINTERKYGGFRLLMNKIKLGQKFKFLAYYVFVSTMVFFILLGATNYSAYSKILYSYINPQYLKDSSKDILDTIDDGKIKVYASDESDDKSMEEKLSKKMEEDDNTVKQSNFSPKKLVPLDGDVSLDLEITPYENRIIIPKIGKNVPLVDVDPRRGLTFENLQDVFMKELEKGVVRYPGTSMPGENGNAFIFGHSSNYPWIKGNYNDIFVLLDDLSFGDEIIVFYNQKKFTYIIKEKKIIKPGDVKVLNREEGKKELSLMTCWPIGTAINRLIVFAELKETK
ncbi:MAG: sortase [Candidatus Gracilibacteria bacterium]|nr:sortase [Candidatus Gracilibacteria bacterium]